MITFRVCKETYYLLPCYCDLLHAIAVRNIACYSELRLQSSRLQSSERYLVAVAAMRHYFYCGRYHRYLLLCWHPKWVSCLLYRYFVGGRYSNVGDPFCVLVPLWVTCWRLQSKTLGLSMLPMFFFSPCVPL
jgi:hypothetical protein